MFAPPSEEDMAMFAPPSAEEMGGEMMAPPEQNSFADSTAGQVVGKVAEYLPEIGGLAGGIAGGVGGTVFGMGVGGVPGAIGGATLGGAAGAAYRDLIETQILGRAQKPTGEVVKDIGKGGLQEGAGQAIGGAVMKGLGFAGRKVLQYGDDALKALKGGVKEARNAVEEPITKLIFERSTPLTPRESGDAVKQVLIGDIKGKYAPFIKAYGELDEVGKALPLKDDARLGFTTKVREWAASDLGGDDYRIVKKFADDLDAADNGAKLRNVISQIGDARSTAYQTGASGQARTLKALQEKANDFMEGETTKLARRISAGKAAPEEVAFIQKAMQAQGIQEPNPTKYAQAIANDYLKSLGKVKTDYAGFKGFLEDVAEQTKIKGVEKGPMSFLDDIKNAPSEKLVERMFDPKNVKALETMKKETPAVFNEIAKARVKNLLEKASPTGELDLVGFQKQVMKLPPDTRRLLFSPEEVAMINKTALSPKLKNLATLEKKLDSKMIGYVQELSTIAGKKVPEYVTASMRQAIGSGPARTAVEMGDMLLPQKEENQSLPRTVGREGE